MQSARRSWTARLAALASLLLVSLVLVACPAPEGDGAGEVDPATVETTPEVGAEEGLEEGAEEAD